MYVQALRTSVFALCPSGAGPNSIRLWEALGFGAIPVILADTLHLPGDAELWQQAALRLPETAEAVAALPQRLAALRQEPERLAAMQAAGRQLWQRYGPHDFVADLNDFLADPDGWLHSQMQPAITAAGAPPTAAAKAPCLSVLMPCRNAGPFLEEAIDSVLARAGSKSVTGVLPGAVSMG
jgi:hypothetical protein